MQPKILITLTDITVLDAEYILAILCNNAGKHTLVGIEFIVEMQ